MPHAGKGGRYHHGDLRSALIEVAIELIAERGVRDFSVAEASRRLGVAASAPYAHFADRDDVLAAVTVRAYEEMTGEMLPAVAGIEAPADRLPAMAAGFVRFAASNRALFDALYESGADKARHPEIEVAERPLGEALRDCVRALTGGSEPLAGSLATAVEATARGFALLLLDGDFGTGPHAITEAADQAARATAALIEGRGVLAGPPARADRP